MNNIQRRLEEVIKCAKAQVCREFPSSTAVN